MNIVSFSGGKDSTAMLIYMMENRIPIDKVVFYDTLMEFPEMYAHIAKVSEYIGVEIEFIIPDRHPFYLMTSHPVNNRSYGGIRYGYGWPTHFRRWCTAEKRTALNKWIRKYAGATWFIGIAADEDRPMAPGKRYPLVEAGISEDQALKMCYEAGFNFGGLYRHFKRVSCWCCPLGGKKRARILWEYYPELWAKLKTIQDVLFHDWGNHQEFIEGVTYTDLELEFSGNGQLTLFNQ